MTPKVCCAFLRNRKFFSLLLRIDEELAAQTQARGCPCSGVLHSANYPRKPRGCLPEAWADFDFRFSFCCNRCRKRSTSLSVRFLGRRVYLGLVVVLRSSQPISQALAATLAVPPRTVQRWRLWWRDAFAATLFWQAACARFMPPVEISQLPNSLLERFAGSADAPLWRLLLFLTPLTVVARSR